jgi:lipopolysaccharide export system protein LptA
MPSIKLRHIIGLIASGMSVFGMPAWAEKADKDKPMVIEADAMRHDEIKLLTQFTGRVVALKGTMVLRGARMEVQQDKNGQQVAQIWAAPNERVFFRQKREGLDEFTEGEGEMVIYDSQADVVTLVQRAELRILRGTVLADQMTGEKIVFNNTTEVMTIDRPSAGAKSTDPRDQRVRAVLTPRTTTPTTVQAVQQAPSPPLPALRVSPTSPEGKKP